MQIKVLTAAGLMVAAFIAGVLISMQFDCGGHVSVPAALPVHTALKPDTVVHDSLIHSTRYRYVDTGRVDSFVHTITIHEHCPEAAATPGATPTVQTVDPPKPFSIPDIVKDALPAVIAHFQPKRDENLFELYAHGHMNLLYPGYGGGLELDMNLEQLHFTPAILFADLGYDRGLHYNVGIEGKIGGWW